MSAGLPLDSGTPKKTSADAASTPGGALTRALAARGIDHVDIATSPLHVMKTAFDKQTRLPPSDGEEIRIDLMPTSCFSRVRP